MTETVLAVDVGGTKLATARVDRAGVLQSRAERPTPVTTDPDVVWAALAEAIDEAVGKAGGKAGGGAIGGTPGDPPIRAVGVGTGGPMHRPLGDESSTTVSPLNIPAWRGFPLVQRVRDQFPGLPVTVVNDAVAMAVGEHAHGSGRGSRSFLGVVVSTGVGGGFVLDGEPLLGRTGNAGHLGHVVVDTDGPPCACGGRGCLEAIARGPAVVAWAREQGWDAGDLPADGRALVAAAQDGHPVALAALTRAGQALGVACASAAALADLDLVAVAGGLANAAGPLLLDPARAALARHAALDFTRECSIVAASLAGDAGLVGAAVIGFAALDRATH